MMMMMMIRRENSNFSNYFSRFQRANYFALDWNKTELFSLVGFIYVTVTNETVVPFSLFMLTAGLLSINKRFD